jgi:hypothetical protein
MSTRHLPYPLRYSLVLLRKTLLRLRRSLGHYMARRHKRRLQRQTLIVSVDRWSIGLRKRY